MLKALGFYAGGVQHSASTQSLSALDEPHARAFPFFHWRPESSKAAPPPPIALDQHGLTFYITARQLIKPSKVRPRSLHAGGGDADGFQRWTYSWTTPSPTPRRRSKAASRASTRCIFYFVAPPGWDCEQWVDERLGIQLAGGVIAFLGATLGFEADVMKEGSFGGNSSGRVGANW